MHAGTLSHVAITTVDDISEPRVCASCSFTNDSTARGCSVELQNDEFTFVFNMSRQSSEELTLLECFLVPEAGVFSISVYEIEVDESMGQNVWRLQDITTVLTIDKPAQSITNGIILLLDTHIYTYYNYMTNTHSLWEVRTMCKIYTCNLWPCVQNVLT